MDDLNQNGRDQDQDQNQSQSNQSQQYQQPNYSGEQQYQGYYQNQQSGQPYDQQGQQYQQQYQQYQQQNQQQNQYTQYQQPYSPYQQGRKQDNGMAIASMICGIVGLTLSCCMGLLGVAVAVVGLVLGILVLRNHKDGKNMAIAGIVLSGISLLIGVIAIIGVIFLANNQTFWDELRSQMENSYY